MTPDFKADKTLNWIDTWKALEKVYRDHPEKVKAIGACVQNFPRIVFQLSVAGVSNVSVVYLEELLKVATVIPAVNQVERHP